MTGLGVASLVVMHLIEFIINVFCNFPLPFDIDAIEALLSMERLLLNRDRTGVGEQVIRMAVEKFHEANYKIWAWRGDTCCMDG